MEPVRRPALDRRRLAEGTAAMIADIVQDADAHGGMLPTLSDLAQRFSVSRAVVRQAVVALAEQGVVEKASSRRWRIVPKEKRGGRQQQRSHGVATTLRTTPAAPDRESLSDQVADGVVEMIVERGLREGDSLPSTRDLAASFDVSLVVVREALAGLAAKGVLDRRQGRQSIVAKPDFESLSSVLRLRAHLEGIDLDEFLVCREALEVQASALAAGSPDRDRKRSALMPHIEGMRAAQARSRAEFFRHDIAFHLEVASLSGNRAIGFILMSLDDMVRAGLLARYDQLRQRAGNPGIGMSVAHHEAVAEAIIAGDVDGAAAAMRSHFAFVARM